MSNKGMFFVLEGGEGSGKSSLISHFKKTLGKEGFIYTREPGGTVFGEGTRSRLLSENLDSLTTLLIMYALRRHHIVDVIRPALDRGVHVICDRFDASTYAYQIGLSKDTEIKTVFNCVHKSVCDTTAPDLVIFLDVPPMVGIDRVKARAKEKGEDLTRFDKKPISFHEGVRESMLLYLREAYAKKHVEIDATRPLDEVADMALSVVRSSIAQTANT